MADTQPHFQISELLRCRPHSINFRLVVLAPVDRNDLTALNEKIHHPGTR